MFSRRYFRNFKQKSRDCFVPRNDRQPQTKETENKSTTKVISNFIRMTFPKYTSGAIGGAIDELTDRQREVLELIKENNRISYREVAEKLQINYSASQAHFDTLKEKKL